MRILFLALALAGIASTAQAGNPAAGEQAFKVCTACHAVGPNATNKVGPELNGVVGRKWGAAPNFSYSADIANGGTAGKVWDEATLSAYLENPKHVAPNGKMPFAGLKDATKRDDVIAYLKQFDQSGNKK
jgi:cytochrome c